MFLFGGGVFRKHHRIEEGEFVGVYPEATISRSFELKEFKTGAARMAMEAGVPLLPCVVWGSQRVFTKNRPKDLTRGTPISVVTPSTANSSSARSIRRRARSRACPTPT